MTLTKIERAMIVTLFMTSLGKAELEALINESTFEQLEIELEEILNENVTLTQMIEAGRSGVHKIIQSLLDESCDR